MITKGSRPAPADFDSIVSMGVINAPWRRGGNIDSCARNCRQREEVANTFSPSLSLESITRASDGFSLDNVDATRCKLPATASTAAASVKVSPSKGGEHLAALDSFCCGSLCTHIVFPCYRQVVLSCYESKPLLPRTALLFDRILSAPAASGFDANWTGNRHTPTCFVNAR